MGFLSSLFGAGDKEPAPRSVESAKDLLPNDIVKMEFSQQSLVSGQSLKVTEQMFYDVSGLENCKTVSVMSGADQRVYLSHSQVNVEQSLEVAISVLPDTVFQLFDQDAFSAIFDEPENTNHRLNLKQQLEQTEGFVAQSYYQERTNEAYRSNVDCRTQALTDAQWTAFDYKLMVSDDRQHAIRIEIYDGGRTDIYLIAYLSLGKVEAFWPAK